MAAASERSLSNTHTDAFHVIRPEHGSASSMHFLSNIDLSFTRPEFATMLFIFRDCFPPSTGAKAVMDSLKSSLSRVLVGYPVLAGRLQESDSSGKLVVNVSGQGVHFVEASAAASLRDWPDLRHCPFEVDLSLDTSMNDPSDVPLIKFQVTQFQCGGLAIAVHFVHVIMDGSSLLKFLNSWAEVYRSGIVNPFNRTCSSNSDKHSFLLARNTPTVDAPVPLLIDSTDKGFSKSNEIPFNLVTLRMEKSAIEECKRNVDTGTFAYGKATGFEAVSSMLWSSLLRAREIPHHLDTSFIFPMDLRTPKFGSVPANYFGNAIAKCQVHARRTGCVVGYDLSYAAGLIHNSKVLCNKKSVQSMLDWMEMNPGGSDNELHWKRGILSTAVTNFPFNEINFGWRGGKVSQICCLPTRVSPHISCFALLPSPKPKAVDVVIGLHNEERDKLLEDHTFTKYFLPEEIKLWTGAGIRKALRRVKH